MNRDVASRRVRLIAPLLAIVALAAGCSGSTVTPSPSPSTTLLQTPAVTAANTAAPTVPAVSPTPTALPTFDGVTPIVLRAGEPVKFPPGLVLYALDGAWEGPSRALRRYYVDGSGQVRTDDLVVSTYGPADDVSRGIVGVVGKNGMADMAVALCHGFCYGGALPVTVMRSVDGGITWADVGKVANGDWATLQGIHGEHVYVRTFAWWGDASAVYALDAPQDALPAPDKAYVVIDPRRDEPTLYTLGEDKWTLLRIDAPDEAPIRIPLPSSSDVSGRRTGFVNYEDGPALQVSWDLGVDDSHTTFVGLVDVENGRFMTVVATRQIDGATNLDIAAWLTPKLAIGRASFVNQAVSASRAPGDLGVSGPAVIDLEARTISPIAELLSAMSYKPGGPVPVGVTLAESFARVTDAGTCLNVREAPHVDASILACYADGVLLPMRAGVEDRDGTTWIAVRTLDGRDGWASKAHLDVP